MESSPRKVTKIIQSKAETLYSPSPEDPSPGAMYPRVIQLKESGFLLATFEQYTRGTPVFPIYRSTNLGATWEKISEIKDTENGWGLRFQPHLYELPTSIGHMSAGTIIAAGNSIPHDRSRTKLDLYKSTDQGLSWSYVSSIMTGGHASIGKNPVWEPFLMVNEDGELVCFYSDEQQKAMGYHQLIAHRMTKDGIHWEPPKSVVAIPDYTSRPGMPIVSQLPNGKYFLTYELVDGPKQPNFPLYYKISDDGVDWGDPSDLGRRIQTPDGLFLGSMPYNIWMPTKHENGMIIVVGKSYRTDNKTVSTSVYLVNENLGEGDWKVMASPLEHDDKLWFTGWSRGMSKISEDTFIELCPIQISEKQAKISYATTQFMK